MAGGRGEPHQSSLPVNGGEIILQMLRGQPHQPPLQPQQQPIPVQSLPYDPAVADVGPMLPLPSFTSSGAHDLRYPYPSPPWPHSPSSFAPHNFFINGGFPPNPNPNWSFPSFPPIEQQLPPGFSNVHSNQILLSDDVLSLGIFAANQGPNSANQQERNLIFGSLPPEVCNFGAKINGISCRDLAPGGVKAESSLAKEMKSMYDETMNSPEGQFHKYVPKVNTDEKGSGAGNAGGLGRQQNAANYRLGAAPQESREPPPGFPSRPKSGSNRQSGNRRNFGNNVDKRSQYSAQSSQKVVTLSMHDRERRLLSGNAKLRVDMPNEQGLSQVDYPLLPAGSNLHSISTSEVEESLPELQGEVDDKEEDEEESHDKMRRGGEQVEGELDDLEGRLLGSLVLEDGSEDKNDKGKRRSPRDKDYRSDVRGKWLLNQKMRNFKRLIECRPDIDSLNVPLLEIYKSLIPAEEEKEKQNQVLMLLEKLVTKEWPNARLYIYGSCANSFGFSRSDIDICLVIEDPHVNKSEVILKLTEMLQSNNLQNVQALTHARVPIVKFMDSDTGISCDICVNNVLAVINTKLLRDYSQIDARLQQLTFIIKHWAKSRGVNETYRGTLSSYAYVLMCIHFLQQRRPAILPCLQGMEATHFVTVDNIECSYFDQVERLHGFGFRNGESIGRLVWAFFNYWAYCHDYANDVISIRTGRTLSKRAKDWTRRVGRDRHLICIEDPFEISHDLGRVVDKFSIRVLREEFERGAEIMRHDPQPCVKLFEPYVLS